MITIKGMQELSKNELKYINAGGLGSCLRRHQRWIRRAISIDSPDQYVTGLIEDMKGCYDGTNRI